MDDRNPLKSTDFPATISLKSFVVTAKKNMADHNWLMRCKHSGDCKETLLKPDKTGTKQDKVLKSKGMFLSIISNPKKSPVNANNNTTPKIWRNFKLILSYRWLQAKLFCLMYSSRLTNKEASAVLCSVVKHAGSGRARKKCRGKHETQSSVFPHLSALPLPKCAATEQSTDKASLFVLSYFPTHPLTELYFPKE